jgi:glutamate/tyrosine decarboxylase-like PLP-dependent enzyme
VVVYRNKGYRRFQYFSYARWPGGLFGSPSLTGTRPGGNIAQAWAALMVLGQEGYLNVRTSTDRQTDRQTDRAEKVGDRDREKTHAHALIDSAYPTYTQ